MNTGATNAQVEHRWHHRCYLRCYHRWSTDALVEHRWHHWCYHRCYHQWSTDAQVEHRWHHRCYQRCYHQWSTDAQVELGVGRHHHKVTRLSVTVLVDLVNSVFWVCAERGWTNSVPASIRHTAYEWRPQYNCCGNPKYIKLLFWECGMALIWPKGTGRSTTRLGTAWLTNIVTLTYGKLNANMQDSDACV